MNQMLHDICRRCKSGGTLLECKCSAGELQRSVVESLNNVDEPDWQEPIQAVQRLSIFYCCHVKRNLCQDAVSAEKKIDHNDDAKGMGRASEVS